MSVNYNHVVMEGRVLTPPGPTTATVYQGIQDLIVELVGSDVINPILTSRISHLV